MKYIVRMHEGLRILGDNIESLKNNMSFSSEISSFDLVEKNETQRNSCSFGRLTSLTTNWGRRE